MRGHGSAGDRQGSIAERFQAEGRDEAWASENEREITERATRALTEGGTSAAIATPSAVECRQETCRLEIAADSAGELARAIEWLSDERGFYRYADDMIVRSLDADDKGPRSVELFLRFTAKPSEPGSEEP